MLIQLKIVDRKKDLVKLQAGEYVSLGKVEAEMKTCPLVENICVYGDPSKYFTVALVVPNPKHFEDLAVKLGVTGDFDALCASPKMEKAVIKELAEHGKKCKLQKFEIPGAVSLCKEVMSNLWQIVDSSFNFFVLLCRFGPLTWASWLLPSSWSARTSKRSTSRKSQECTLHRNEFWSNIEAWVNKTKPFSF